MSSNVYSAEIFPDPFLRQLVLVSGALLGIAGILLIGSLALSVALRAAGAALWGLTTFRELVVLRRAWASCLALRFAENGAVEIRGPDLEWHAARLVSGSVLLRRMGWIRLKSGAGSVFAELVRADRQQARDWRRLHVIWRHVGAPDRSC